MIPACSTHTESPCSTSFYIRHTALFDSLHKFVRSPQTSWFNPLWPVWHRHWQKTQSQFRLHDFSPDFPFRVNVWMLLTEAPARFLWTSKEIVAHACFPVILASPLVRILVDSSGIPPGDGGGSGNFWPPVAISHVVYKSRLHNIQSRDRKSCIMNSTACPDNCESLVARTWLYVWWPF